MTEQSFESLGLPPVLTANLAELGITEPKPIQAKAIAPLMAGRDILAIAQTGSGKTFAFALPILAKLISLGAKRPPKSAAALVLAPTRELAVQIEAAMRAATRNMHLRLGLVLGGVSRLKQIKQMAGGVDVLIATPGRLMDHVREGNIDLSHTKSFVLDEADRMLDMGFIRDVRAIAAKLASPRQTALFSATMPKEVSALAESLLNNPERVETAPQGSVVAAIAEAVYRVPQAGKKEALTRLLAQESFRSAIVFTRTKHGADMVARVLAKAGCGVDVIHGNKSQNARQRALEAFRSGAVRVLVATDIAARGIDIPGVSHVVNYEFPVEAESYVHRIGRTGRNGAEGEAVTLYDPAQEASRLRAIERLTGKKLPVAPMPELPAAVFPKSERAPSPAVAERGAGRGGKPRREKFGAGRPRREKFDGEKFGGSKSAGEERSFGERKPFGAKKSHGKNFGKPRAPKAAQGEQSFDAEWLSRQERDFADAREPRAEREAGQSRPQGRRGFGKPAGQGAPRRNFRHGAPKPGGKPGGQARRRKMPNR